jgi:serine/threonine protein kinase
MIGGKNISEGYKGLTIELRNPEDNIDFYNIFKNNKPKKITLYGNKTKIRLNDSFDEILELLEDKTNYIVKKFKRGNIISGNAKFNFNNEMKSIKTLFKIYGDEISNYTAIKPIFNYNNIDIYAISYSNHFYIFQEKCYKTIDKIQFTQDEFNKMINDIYESLLILQKNNFLHNDIKADNIIYCDNKYKIIDWELSYSVNSKFKSFFKGSGGNFLFNHPYKFYNLGIPLFIYNFFNYIFKRIDYKANSWIYKLKSYKILNNKIRDSFDYLVENKTGNLYKYYDMYSFALLIIYLAEKNKCDVPSKLINELFIPFNINY